MTPKEGDKADVRNPKAVEREAGYRMGEGVGSEVGAEVGVSWRGLGRSGQGLPGVGLDGGRVGLSRHGPVPAVHQLPFLPSLTHSESGTGASGEGGLRDR